MLRMLLAPLWARKWLLVLYGHQFYRLGRHYKNKEKMWCMGRGYTLDDTGREAQKKVRLNWV